MLRILAALALAIGLACGVVLAQEPPKPEAARQGSGKESVSKRGVSGAPSARLMIRGARPPASMDRAPAMVAVELLVAQVKSKVDEKADVAKLKAGEAVVPGGDMDAQLRALEKRGQVEILCRSCLATCNQQSAFLKAGRREPRITGTAVNRTGSVHSTTMENVGLAVTLTPCIGDGMTNIVEIEVEDSRLGPVEEGTPISVSSSGETIRTPRVDTLNVRSTVSMLDGQAVLVSGRVEQSKSTRTELVVLVSSRVIQSGKGK